MEFDYSANGAGVSLSLHVGIPIVRTIVQTLANLTPEWLSSKEAMQWHKFSAWSSACDNGVHKMA